MKHSKNLECFIGDTGLPLALPHGRGCGSGVWVLRCKSVLSLCASNR